MRRSWLRCGAVLVFLAVMATLNPARAGAATLYAVGGTVSTVGPVDTLSVRALDQSGQSVALFNTTRFTGRYSLVVPAGTYDFRVSGSGSYRNSALGISAGGGFLYTVQDVVVSGATSTLSLFLPQARLTVHLQSADGTPREGMLAISCVQNADPAAGIDARRIDTFTASYRTDPTITGFALDSGAGPGCTLTVRPADGVSLAPQAVTLTGTGDELTVTLPDVVEVQGSVQQPFRLPPTKQSVQALDGSRVLTSATPDVAGHYSLHVSPGDYRLLFQSSNEAGGESYSLMRAVTVTSDGLTVDSGRTTRDVTVHLVDGAGDPVEGVVGMSCQGGTDAPDAVNGGWTVRRNGPDAVLPVPPGPDWTCQVSGTVGTGDNETTFSPDRRVSVTDTDHEFTLLARSRTLLDGAPGASHADADGVPDLLEASGPNGGDGNYDGVPDYQQADVATLPRNGASSAGSNPYSWVTLVGPAGSSLENVSTLDPTSVATSAPAGVSLPAGLIRFSLTGVTPGSDQTVSFFVSDTTGVNGYAKYHPGTSTWSMLPAGRVTTDPSFGRVDVRLTDGGPGDDDGGANGTIVDPGGIAVVPPDSTPPVVTGAATTAPNAAGWYHDDVRVTWTASDADSGPVAQPADTVVTGQGDALVATSDRVCDLAPQPNCATGTLGGLKIDRTSPSVAVTGVAEGATYTLGAVPAAGCSASDALSGLAGTCSGGRTGGRPNGVGTFTYTASATDRAGNSRTTSASYQVVYKFDGFQQPVNDPGISPGSALSVFKGGSTVPLSFTLRNASGQPVLPLSLPLLVTPVRGAKSVLPVNESVSSGHGSSGSYFLPDLRLAWHYDWSTKDLAGGFQYQVGVSLDDGTTHRVTVVLR